MIYAIGVILTLFDVIICNESTVSPSFLKKYNDKVCNNEPSCDLINTPNLPDSYKTMEGRDCMCDSECPEYNDCCLDSDYYETLQLNNINRTYHCSPAAEVYMVISCDENYVEKDIKEKCYKSTLPLESDNIHLVLPVTNIKKRITYANAYCAICNNDYDVKMWSIAAECGELQKSNGKPPNRAILSTTAPSSTKIVPTATESSKSKYPPANQNKTKTFSSSTTKKNIFSKNTLKENDSDMQDNSHLTKITDQSSTPHSNLLSILHNQAEGIVNTDVTVGSQSLSVVPPSVKLKPKIFFRSVRQTSTNSYTISNVNKYIKHINEIFKTAKYDPATKYFTTKYNNSYLGCQIGSIMPKTLESYTRRCVPNLISSCNNNSQNSEENKKCLSFMAIVYDQSTNKWYRNKDCALCNNVSLDKTKGCLQRTRTKGSDTFSSDNKLDGADSSCSDPALAGKFC